MSSSTLHFCNSITRISLSKFLGIIVGVSCWFASYGSRYFFKVEPLVGVFVPAIIVICASFYFFNRKGFRKIDSLIAKNMPIYLSFSGMFLLPFGVYFYRYGNLFEQWASVSELLFRFIFLTFLLSISLYGNPSKFWEGVLLVFVFAGMHLFYRILYYDTPFHMQSSIFIFVGMMYFFLKFEHKKVLNIFLLMGVFALFYLVFRSRSLAVGLLLGMFILLLLRYKLIYRVLFTFKKTILVCMLLVSVFLIREVVKIDQEFGMNNAQNSITSGRGAIWEFYIERALETQWFGKGHQYSNEVFEIAEKFEGNLILKKQITSGGPHNSFILLYYVKGWVGIIFFLLFLYYAFFKHIRTMPKQNILLFCVFFTMMFASGSVSILGLTTESLLFSMSFLVPVCRTLNKPQVNSQKECELKFEAPKVG